jgi:hypothetical protein
MADAFISSRTLVEDIWRRVAQDRDARLESHIRPLPELDALNHDIERHFINAHCVLDRGPTEVPSAPPLSGLKAKFKKRAASFTMAVLQRYFADEEVFIAHLVRFQNNIADAHDQLAREVNQLHHGVRLEVERLSGRIALLEEALQSQERG